MTLTIGKLKELIQDMPDDMLVIRSGDDHSYVGTVARFRDVWFQDGGDHMSEYWPEVPLEKNDFVDVCLVID